MVSYKFWICIYKFVNVYWIIARGEASALEHQRKAAGPIFRVWIRNWSHSSNNNETDNEQKLEKAILKTQDGANLKNKNLAKQGKITLVPDNCYPITIGGVGHKAYKL